MNDRLELSEEKLQTAVLRLIKFSKGQAKRIFSRLAIEQQFFVIDRALFLQRPDLVLCGRTLFGAKSESIGAFTTPVLKDIRDIRPSETVPSQYSLSSPFEKTSLGIEHNISLIKQVQAEAQKQNLAALFHEKPFMGIDRSVKICSWTIETDQGENLLAPNGNQIISHAISRAFHEHSALIKANISLETDRLDFRTSSDLREVMTVIHATVADSLMLILDEIETLEDVPAVLCKFSPIYLNNLKDREYANEAPRMRNELEAFKQFTAHKTVAVFDGIFNEDELQLKYESMVEEYVKTVQGEADLMIELFQTKILPKAQKDMLERGLSEPLIDQAVVVNRELKKLLSQITDMGWEAKAKVFSELIEAKMGELRGVVDQLELIVDDALWPLPKYRELLFG